MADLASYYSDYIEIVWVVESGKKPQNMHKSIVCFSLFKIVLLRKLMNYQLLYPKSKTKRKFASPYVQQYVLPTKI